MSWIADASAAAAFAAYVLGLLVIFGVRSRVHRRRTGSSGFNGISGRPGSLQWCAGVVFVAGLVLGLLAPALAALGVVSVPVGAWRYPLAVVGSIVAAGGIVGVVVAQTGMGDSWRIGVDQDERTDLVTTGAFALVRNPIFTAMITAQAGFALIAPTWLSMLALVLLIAAVQVQVRVIEEPYLARVHGDAYHDYTVRAGRFVPRVGRGGGRRSLRPAVAR